MPARHAQWVEDSANCRARPKRGRVVLLVEVDEAETEHLMEAAGLLPLRVNHSREAVAATVSELLERLAQLETGQ
jgi:hypothetical protein